MVDNDPAAVKSARQDLRQYLVAQAKVGVPEVVLVGLLREEADHIERIGCISRQWGQGSAEEDS